MIIVSATLDFADRAARDHAVEVTASTQLATRVEEEGCLSYCFAPDPCVDTRIQVFELWADEAALVAHFKHHTYAAMRDLLMAEKIVGTQNRMYLVARDEPVYDAQGKAREAFFTDPLPGAES
jgi:quinol monooxygenase YgiN